MEQQYTHEEYNEILTKAVKQTMLGVFQYLEENIIIVDKDGKYLPDVEIKPLNPDHTMLFKILDERFKYFEIPIYSNQIYEE